MGVTDRSALSAGSTVGVGIGVNVATGVFVKAGIDDGVTVTPNDVPRIGDRGIVGFGEAVGVVGVRTGSTVVSVESLRIVIANRDNPGETAWKCTLSLSDPTTVVGSLCQPSVSRSRAMALGS